MCTENFRIGVAVVKAEHVFCYGFWLYKVLRLSIKFKLIQVCVTGIDLTVVLIELCHMSCLSLLEKLHGDF